MKVLFLTHRLPYAPNRGDRLRAYHILRHLRNRFEMHLFSLVHDHDEEAHAPDLQGLAASVTTARVSRPRNLLRAAASLVTTRPLTHVLLDSSAAKPRLLRLARDLQPDLVLAYCSGMARFAMEPPLSGIPFVLDMVDVDSAKWTDMAQRAALPMKAIYAREGRLLRRFEANAVRQACATIVVNARERELVAELAEGARVVEIGNGIDLAAFSPPLSAPRSGPTVVFCGVMNYAPNEEGARWLAREVWPAVRARKPDARLILAGANPPPSVRTLGESDPSITVTGTVDDVRPFLWGAAVAAAPLFVARGIQNKVVEALAAGLPCVVTPAVYQGLPDNVKVACVAASDASAFARALLELLLASVDERQRLAGSADLKTLRWDERLSALDSVLTRSVEA